MRRPDAVQALASEEALSTRIAYERDARGWSYEALAKRMTAAGCPVNQSSIYKIEKGQPRRRVTVNELIALSTVLDLDIVELLLPPEAIIQRRQAELLGEIVVALNTLADYGAGLNSSWHQLIQHVDRPEGRTYIEDRLQRIEREDVRRLALEALARSEEGAVFRVKLSVQPAAGSGEPEKPARGQRRKTA